jgi:membrane protease subunit HflK
LAWNKQTGGWKGNGGPWGQGPRTPGGGSTPPDLEELLRRSQDRLRRVLPGGGGRGLNPLTIVAILALATAFIIYYFFTFRVEPNELGIVLRFGQYDRQAESGLHFRLPYPVETVFTPELTTVHQVTIGFDDRAGGTRDLPDESLMLTGDENIVDIDFSVFWVIGSSENARNYLFNMVDPDGTVRAAAQSAMREVVGQSNIQDLLTQARQTTESKVQTLLQRTLDQFGAGVTVTQVQLLKVDPPAEVVAAFRDVQAAQADAVRLQNEAQTYANQVVPQARGQAAQITNAASAFQDRIIAEARGQAQAFDSVYQSYKTAPDVTRQRMYFEMMEQILAGKDKIIIDESAAGSSGVVPYLPLDSLRPGPATPSTGNR